jgi:hypothetical protein
LENRLFEIIGAADVELVVTNSSFVESFAGQDKEQFAVGVSALVNELKTDTTKMIRDTANNIFDIAQFAYLTSEGQTQPLMSRLNSSDPNELLKVLSETSDDGNKTNLGKLTDIILQNKLFDIISAPNVELAITKSRFFDDFVNEFGEDKAQFAVGANAFVNSLRTDISGTLRNVTNNVTDVYNFLNHIPAGQTQTILSRLDLSDQWEFITVLNEVYPDGNNKTNLGKLTDIILQNKLFDIISAPNAEKAVINSIFVDDLGKSGWDTTLVKQDLETLLGTTKNGKTAREKWKELFATIDKSVGVIAELRTAPDLIEEYEKNGDVDRGDMLPKDDAVNAMLYYIKNDLTDPTIDDLAAALHDLAFSFNSIRKFIDDMLLDFDVSEYSLYDQNDKPIVDVEEFKKGLVDGMFGEYDESSKQFITDPDKDAWVSRIKSIQQVASSVLSFKTMQSGDVGGMLETLLTGGSELVDLIANDQTVANIVGNIIESQMEELSKDSPISISLPKDGDNNYDKEAIAEVANIMTDLVTSAAAAMESSEPIDLTEMVDDKKDELLSLANSGVVITVDDTVPDGEEQSSLDKIADTITNLEDITEEEKNALRNLFGIK